MNITDPDSRNLKCPRGYEQGYNAQAVVTAEQVVIAAEINTDSPDFGHLQPMVGAARRQLRKIGIFNKPEVVVADAGYWHTEQMDSLAASGIPLLIPPDAGKRKTARPGWEGERYAWMRSLLATERSPPVPKTAGHSRARVRPDRVQPQTHPISPKRPRRRAQRVAINHRDAQPAEAARSPNSHRNPLKGFRGRPPADPRITATANRAASCRRHTRLAGSARFSGAPVGLGVTSATRWSRSPCYWRPWPRRQPTHNLRRCVHAYSAGHPWPPGDALSQAPRSATSTKGSRPARQAAVAGQPPETTRIHPQIDRRPAFPDGHRAEQKPRWSRCCDPRVPLLRGRRDVWSPLNRPVGVGGGWPVDACALARSVAIPAAGAKPDLSQLTGRGSGVTQRGRRAACARPDGLWASALLFTAAVRVMRSGLGHCL